MDRKFIDLYDEYTHKPLPRRQFLERLAVLAGGTATAYALLAELENNYAAAQMIAFADPRLAFERIQYSGAGGAVRGYLVRPAGAAKRGGVIVIHENRGLNAHIEDVARRAAIAGFNALAPDLLSPAGGTPEDADKARDMFRALDQARTVANLRAAVAYFKGHADANGKIGCVGFCWGGGMVNLLAASEPGLAVAVPFYGLVAPSDQVSRIKAKLLLHYAANDERINAGIGGYETALKAANVSYTLHMYPGTQHAFHNDTAGPRYDKAAAELAWSRTVAFFKAELA